MKHKNETNKNPVSVSYMKYNLYEILFIYKIFCLTREITRETIIIPGHNRKLQKDRFTTFLII